MTLESSSKRRFYPLGHVADSVTGLLENFWLRRVLTIMILVSVAIGRWQIAPDKFGKKIYQNSNLRN